MPQEGDMSRDLSMYLVVAAFVALAVVGAVAFVMESGGPDQYPGVWPW